MQITVKSTEHLGKKYLVYFSYAMEKGGKWEK